MNAKLLRKYFTQRNVILNTVSYVFIRGEQKGGPDQQIFYQKIQVKSIFAQKLEFF